MPRGYTRASLGIIWAWDIQLDSDCMAMYHFRRPLRLGLSHDQPSRFSTRHCRYRLFLSQRRPICSRRPATAAPASSTWDSGAVRHLLPTVSDSRMLIKASLQCAADGRPDAARRRYLGARPHERHARRALAFPCDRSRAGPPLSAVARRRRRARAVRAVGARDVSRSRRAAGAVPRAVLLLRRRPRGDEVSCRRGTQPAVPARAELSSRRPRSPTAITSIGICCRR